VHGAAPGPPPGREPGGRPECGPGFGLGGNRSNTSLKRDGQGIATYAFESPGLWYINVRFRDTELRSFPTHEEPYYEAEALLPVSPGLAPADPIRLVGVRRERGSLRVQLLDSEARPARGMFEIVEFEGQVDYAGATDDRGVVQFKDMPSRAYQLRGFIGGRRRRPSRGPSEPMPEDTALRGRFVVPGDTATVAAGKKPSAELRARPVGYVCGTLRPRAGHKVSEYLVTPGCDRRILEPRWRLEPDSGQFLCGPLLAGTVRIRFQQRMRDGT
jgi:hypothetical protein